MKNLDEISDFGANAAEDDSLLARCFQSHPIFHNVLYDRHFLILGRKGSGKTAICKEIISLCKKRDDFFSVEYDFAGYPWDYDKLIAVSSDAKQERYLHSWRYLILLSLAKILLKSAKSRPNSDAFKKIMQFVIDTYGSTDLNITTIFEPPGKRIRGLKRLGVDILGFGVEAEADELEVKNLPRMFQDVNSTLQRLIVESLSPDCRYYICFDGLDIGFQPDSFEYQQRLIGLILAARDFSRAGSESGRFLKVPIFLRTDIYKNHLLFEDKNKITRTYGLEIEWDKPHHDMTLKSIMERRFTEVLGINPEGAWNQVFDESEGMGGHSTKYAYVLDHTFRRPRDMIEFCNCILNVYRHRRRDKEKASQLNKFTNKDIYEARAEYSEYFYDEIKDEIHKRYPDYTMYFEILRYIGYQLFTREAFLEAYQVWKDRLKSPKQAEDILEYLFEISVIGFARNLEGGLSKARYIFKYLDNAANFNRSYEHFSVHWGLVTYLALKRDQPSRNFESQDPNITGSINVKVLAANGYPTTIIRTDQSGIIRVDWDIHGVTVPALEGYWVVTSFFEIIGSGLDQKIGPIKVPVKSGVYSSIPYPSFSYTLDMPTPDGIPPGVYKLAATLVLSLPDGTSGPVTGYDEGPIVQFYSPS